MADMPNELDIAKAIRSGELPSPQQYENLWLFDVRITGTGTSYRTGLDEYVYRPPENFLSDEFMERCNGLPLIFEHPGESILDTDEYRNRAIGNVILPYIKGDEVWGVAKVYDADAARLMTTSHLSTSPAVVFREAGSTSSVELSDGSTLLIEGKPSYLDHLAICEAGVWDKGGEPSGIQLTGDTEMADEERVPAWADSLNKRFDEVCSRLDAMEKGGEKKDSFEGLEKKVEGEGYDKEAAEKIAGKVAEEKKADGAEKEGEEEAKEEGEAEKHLEAAEKDGKKEEKAERKDGEYMDAQKRENAELKAQIKAMQSRIESIAKPLTANDRDQLSAAQARADSVARLFGDSVNPPMHGESPIAYRKRLAAKFQKHSAANKTTRLDSLDESVFAQIEDRIYADAQQIAASPAVMQPGRLMEHRETDRSGRVITTYTGDPMAWMKPFMAVSAISRINTNHPKGA